MYDSNIVEGRVQTIDLLIDENFLASYEVNPRIASLLNLELCKRSGSRRRVGDVRL